MGKTKVEMSQVAKAKEQYDNLDRLDSIEIIKGDVLKSGADVIMHQVNCLGVMGSGVARAIRNMYPQVFEEYSEFCSKFTDSKMLLGHCQEVLVTDTYTSKELSIFNLFGQHTCGCDPKVKYTLLSQLRKSLLYARDIIELEGHKTIAIPYLIGCGLGNETVTNVDNLIREIFYDCDCTVKYYDIN